MAPFGRNFLKARQKKKKKNRPKEAEPPEGGKEIQVTVCGEEKVVCGVTKHTTCLDMIQALLDDHESAPEGQRVLHGDPKDFILVERWRGLERALPPLTRILRLWTAWGDQRPFIQFTLLRTSDFVPQTPTKKTAKPKGGGAKPKRWDQARGQPLPPERQKRLVKKAFRKLEKIHKESRICPGAEDIDRMVQLILNQDHEIREQIQRLRELDLDIDTLEKESQVLYTSDGVDQLDLQVQRHQDLILQLSRDIEAELRKADSPQQEVAGAASCPPAVDLDESLYALELQRLQQDVQRSVSAGVSLHRQAAEVHRQLQAYEASLVSKDHEVWTLASQLSSLELEEEGGEQEETVAPLETTTPSSISSNTLKLSVDPTDTDSDTGISSTHSQDSLSPCRDFPPPLDTDV